MKQNILKCKDCAWCSTIRVEGMAICQYTAFNVWTESVACSHFFSKDDIW